MEDEHIVLREGEALIVEAEDAGVFARRREETALHALELDAQDFDDVRVLDRILDALVHDDARLLVEEAGRSVFGPAMWTSMPIVRIA